jgi:hypothetical protein
MTLGETTVWGILTVKMSLVLASLRSKWMGKQGLTQTSTRASYMSMN